MTALDDLIRAIVVEELTRLGLYPALKPEGEGPRCQASIPTANGALRSHCIRPLGHDGAHRFGPFA